MKFFYEFVQTTETPYRRKRVAVHCDDEFLSETLCQVMEQKLGRFLQKFRRYFMEPQMLPIRSRRLNVQVGVAQNANVNPVAGFR